MKTKKLITITLLAIMLVTLIVFGVFVACNPNDKVETQDQPEMVVDADMEIIPTEENGISIKGVDIPRSLYSQYGISPIVQNAKTLTATVTPADAENKMLDWSVAWKNSSATWAKGKTVTDYITVTPTSDGALTATVTCNQAFGEKIIITACIRGAEGINTSCTCEYTQKVIGANLSADSYLSLNTSNLNPTIDFPFQFRSEADEQSAAFTFFMSIQGPISITPVYSDVYTKEHSKNIDEVTVSTSLSTYYFNALKDSGAIPSVSSAESYGASYNPKGTGSLGSILGVTRFADGGSGKFYSNYCKVRAVLKQNCSNVMLHLKVVLDFRDDQSTTIYNIKFSASSLATLATGLSFNPTELDF